MGLGFAGVFGKREEEKLGLCGGSGRGVSVSFSLCFVVFVGGTIFWCCLRCRRD
jgi:hypothetical protein